MEKSAQSIKFCCVMKTLLEEISLNCATDTRASVRGARSVEVPVLVDTAEATKLATGRCPPKHVAAKIQLKLKQGSVSERDLGRGWKGRWDLRGMGEDVSTRRIENDNAAVVQSLTACVAADCRNGGSRRERRDRQKEAE